MNSIRMKIFLLMLFSFFINTLFAADDAETIIKKLQKKYDSIKDASVTYVQHVQFGVTKSEQSFSGSLTMKKGNKYRIEMEQQIIVTDGKSVWSLSKANNQVLIDKYKEDPKSFSIDKIFMNLPANYNATLLGKEKLGEQDVQILKLTPKKDRSNFKWMKVWIDSDEYTMKKIQILENSENLITYTLNEIKLNQNVSDSIFQYIVPDGVEVIDLR